MRCKKRTISRSKGNDFGALVGKFLAEAHISQSAAADKTNISQPYFNQILNGLRRPNPHWIDIVAANLRLNKDRRRELHLSAARDLGFKL